MKLRNIKQVIKNDFCLGCGLCHVIHTNVEIKEENGNLKSNFTNIRGLIDHINVCPAAGYDIHSLGKEIHQVENYSYELGWYKNIRMAHSCDDEILKHASSGGIMTSIALYMLEKGLANGIICTKYDYSNGNARPICFIARNKLDLEQAQGSKYCPTKTLELLSQLKDDEKYVLIGTPCQIAGWRKYNKEFKTSQNIILSIANFCGGYRDYREIDFFVKNIAGFSTIIHFQHRGDGVPGQMKIVSSEGQEWKYPYPDYARLSPIQKNKRCVYCIDSTGELADISCGDTWLDRVKNSKQVWSTIITRNEASEKIVSKMIRDKIIEVGVITEKEVIESQRLNISSKKYRQFKRIRLMTLLFNYVPNWYSCVKNVEGSYYNECRILLSKFYHSLKRKLKA